MNEAAFLSALHESPADEVTWSALADWLDDDGQADRAELLRAVRRLLALPVLRRSKERSALEGRLAALLLAGVQPVVAEITNSIGMRLALIPPGRFRMGSPAGEERHEDGERAHEVTISRPFYLGVFAVTQAQYEAVMRSNPSHFRAAGQGRSRVTGLDTSAFPVEQANWNDAARFCRRLTKREAKRRPGTAYRLPSEAEWEYACRAGTTTAYHFGDTLGPALANYDVSKSYNGGPAGDPLKRPVPVGSFRPNAFGLYDVHGNAWEWCLDGRRLYSGEPATDPVGPTADNDRMIRGGGWDSWPWGCRSAYRCVYGRNSRSMHVGFRVALAAE
jgi:uncharacterized protein (TIGR02996 family)